eukprot:366051-Chlamydomonas_euryale.AAC.1
MPHQTAHTRPSSLFSVPSQSPHTFPQGFPLLLSPPTHPWPQVAYSMQGADLAAEGEQSAAERAALSALDGAFGGLHAADAAGGVLAPSIGAGAIGSTWAAGGGGTAAFVHRGDVFGAAAAGL